MLLKPERSGKYFRRVQQDHGKCAGDSTLADHAECCSHRNYGRVTCSANIRACLGLNTKSYGFNVAKNVNIETSIFQIPKDTVWHANLFYTPIAYCWIKCTYSWWRKTVTMQKKLIATGCSDNQSLWGAQLHIVDTVFVTGIQYVDNAKFQPKIEGNQTGNILSLIDHFREGDWLLQN